MSKIIQFRLSKNNDQDLIEVFKNSNSNTQRAKELIRLGIKYEDFLKTRQDVAPPKKLTPMQQQFIEMTNGIRVNCNGLRITYINGEKITQRI